MIRYTKEFIQQLLDKYMNGTSTLEEEDILAQYFRTQEVPQEWDNYRQLFQEIEAMKPQPAPRHWARWSIAVAAILIGVCFLFPIGQKEHSANRYRSNTAIACGNTRHDSVATRALSTCSDQEEL